MRSRLTQCIVFSLAAAALAFGFVAAAGIARGQGHSHHDAAGRFYSTWMMPDRRTMSCCSDRDCYATEAKQVGDHWFARIRETGEWVRIPPDKIETERDNPDGQNHLCASPGGQVYCFIVGGGI